MELFFKGSGMRIEFIWLRVERGDGHMWPNGVFLERWSIAFLTRWLSGSYEDTAPVRVRCSVLWTHTHSSEQYFYAFAVCPDFLFKWLVSYSYSPNFETALHFYPSITYTHTLFHVTYMALWDVLNICCLIGVYCLNRPFCIAYSCVLNTASQHVCSYSRNLDSFIVRLNPSVIS